MSSSEEKKNDKSTVDTISQDPTSTENDSNVNTSLIEKILCEMKNEFNRSGESNASSSEPSTKARSNSCDKRTTKESGRKSVSKSTRSKSSSESHAETSRSFNAKSQNNDLETPLSRLKLESDAPTSKGEKSNSRESLNNDKPNTEATKSRKSSFISSKKGVKMKQIIDTPKSTRLKNSQEKKISSSSARSDDEVLDPDVSEKGDATSNSVSAEDVKVGKETVRSGLRPKSSSERKSSVTAISCNDEGEPDVESTNKNDSDVKNVTSQVSKCVKAKDSTPEQESETSPVEDNPVVHEKESETIGITKSEVLQNDAKPEETAEEISNHVENNNSAPSQTEVSSDFAHNSEIIETSKDTVEEAEKNISEVNEPQEPEEPAVKVESMEVDNVLLESNLPEEQKTTEESAEIPSSFEADQAPESVHHSITEVLPEDIDLNVISETTTENGACSSPLLAPESIKLENDEENSAKPASNVNQDYQVIVSKEPHGSIKSSTSDVTNKLTVPLTDDSTPRIILTLKATEERKEGSPSPPKAESKRKEIQYSVTVKEELIASSEEFLANCTEESEGGRSRRVCRNREAARTEKHENDNSIKRSSRRTSKEFSFESVLQNAIARKEKSFGSLNGVEDRLKRSRYGSTDLRQSARISKSRANKTSPESKSVDASVIHVPEEFKPVVVCNLFPQDNVKTSYEVSEISEAVANAKEADSIPTEVEVSNNLNEQTAEVPIKTEPGSKIEVDSISSNSARNRKKKRYFRGFRYSLKSGVARLVARSKKTKNEGMPNLQKDSTLSDSILPIQSIKSEPNDTACESSLSVASSESNSSMSLKRKYQNDLMEDEINGTEKMRRMDVPSPSTAEGSDLAAVPESSAISIGGGTAAICLCQVNERVFVSPKIVEEAKEIYCQAIDSLDAQKIGCCNSIDKENNKEAVMLRPSVRVPYQLLCNVHFQRLIRHNCCPGCGLFCTQGRFVQCESFHQYHRECELMLDGKPTCPHCGQDSPKSDVLLSLGEHKNPVFFPFQKPPKMVPSARMSIGDSNPQYQPQPESPPPPIVPPASLILPSGTEITSEGMPPSLDKDKLDELLHAASQSSCLDARITYRTLYHAAKNGETDKVIAALGAGLNPNHQFREWVMGSALHGACVGGHIGIVHILIQAGAQLDVIDRDQNTPLILAAGHAQNEVVKYLVKAGASITFKGDDGMTALHLAAKAGNLEACHYLLSSPRVPSDFINLTDDGGWTPLVWAAEHSHTHVIRFLLEKSADTQIRDAEQNIALHWATYSGSTGIAELLLDYGSELNCTNIHGDTPLHIAARRNHYDCVILLLARGALTSLKNKAGFSVLESCVAQPSNTHRALQLNSKLQELTAKMSERTQVILTTDITRGHETNPIQCINGVDSETEPLDYVYVTENCFTSNISVVRTITSLQACTCTDCSSGDCACGKISFQCWYDKDGRLTPEFNYTDPPMLFECNQACKCNKVLCTNRVVQKGITGRFQLFRTKDNKGWGVITLNFIPKGTYVCEYIGEIISDYEADTREDDSYLFDLDNRDDETYCIDARRYGNIARFINHSCVPNLQPVRVFIGHQDLRFPRIAFFANRDIQPYEELGFDYGEKFWIIKYKSFTCTCKAKTCRYSVSTIQETLNNYNKKIQEMESS